MIIWNVFSAVKWFLPPDKMCF